jgi:hypothetical protein
MPAPKENLWRRSSQKRKRNICDVRVEQLLLRNWNHQEWPLTKVLNLSKPAFLSYRDSTPLAWDSVEIRLPGPGAIREGSSRTATAEEVKYVINAVMKLTVGEGSEDHQKNKHVVCLMIVLFVCSTLMTRPQLGGPCHYPAPGPIQLRFCFEYRCYIDDCCACPRTPAWTDYCRWRRNGHRSC